jgi:hypothetical protein
MAITTSNSMSVKPRLFLCRFIVFLKVRASRASSRHHRAEAPDEPAGQTFAPRYAAPFRNAL